MQKFANAVLTACAVIALPMQNAALLPTECEAIQAEQRFACANVAFSGTAVLGLLQNLYAARQVFTTCEHIPLPVFASP